MEREKLKALALEYVKYVKNNYDWDYYWDWLIPLVNNDKDRIWDRPLVSSDTFIDHEDFLGIAEDIFPSIKKICLYVTAGDFREMVLVAGIGSGKCFAKDTEILMHSGYKKKVQDIIAGEKVMGPDSLPRNVVGTTKGTGTLYRITPKKGDPFVVNADHILPLRRTPTTRGVPESFINISVRDYLLKSEKFKKTHKLYRSGVEFEEKPVPFDPYFVGLWLGDGLTNRVSICTQDKEVVDYIYETAKKYNHKVSINQNTNKTCPSYHISNGYDWRGSDVREIFVGMNLFHNKHIPDCFKINSREIRLKMLAGLLDSDGYLYNNSFEFSNKNERLIDDFVYLARSLGFAAYKKSRTTKCNGKEFASFRVSLSGNLDEIPTRVARRKAAPRKQKRSVLATGFAIEEIGVGDYYGFEVDKDHLFLLGDFTVTHNSFSSQILGAYAAFRLLCMRDPHKFFGLAKDKDIAIINMGPSAQQAKSVVFTGMANLIKDSPFFKRYNPDVLKTEVRFDRRRIIIVSGNSKETTPLGKNVFYAILDEAAFFMDNDNNSVAEAIYNQLKSRIISRFGNYGMLALISSPRYEYDFIMSRLKDSRLLDENSERKFPDIYSLQAPTWKVQKKYEDELYKDPSTHFYFDVKMNTVLSPEDFFALDYDKSGEDISLIHDSEDHMHCRFWQIPNEFKPSFLANPEKSKRDFGAIPSLTIEGFFPNPRVITELWNPYHQNPEQPDGTLNFYQPFKVPHYVHVDLALNKNGKGDYAGVSMVSVDRWERDEETGAVYPIVYVHLVKQILAGPTGEIEFEDVRNLLFNLQEFGFWLQLVTFDGWQSTDSMQILKSKGVNSEYLSVDKSLDPYNTLKTLINTHRIDIYHHGVLESELLQLELVKGMKVDHPNKGHKDLSDSLAGAVFNCVKSETRGFGFAM